MAASWNADARVSPVKNEASSWQKRAGPDAASELTDEIGPLHGRSVKAFVIFCIAVLACASTRETGGSADPAAAGAGIDPPLDGGVAEDRPCETNAGCAFTRVAPGACCPMLCTPRVVTRKRAGELAANVAACNRGQGCPQPLCRPISHSIEPKCEAGRCVGRTTAPPQD